MMPTMIHPQHIPLTIWVDADACPVTIKELLYRAAVRTETATVFVANSPLRIPSSPHLTMLHVSDGFDVADDEIVQRMQAGDLVITSDIPLAHDVLEQGGFALSVRGELFSKSTIKARLGMRDFLETLRSSGIHGDSTPTFKASDKQAFANQLDGFLTKHKKMNR